nr:LysR family transcriptional regulator [Pseudomonas sp. R4-34-07]
MDIEELQTFVEVADAGGISQAARRLGVSKSIVTTALPSPPRSQALASPTCPIASLMNTSQSAHWCRS